GLYDAVKAVGEELCPQLGLTIPVGKDSMSMKTRWQEGNEQRETLLLEANKIIREHEDTMAGIVATGVTQRNGVLVFSGDYFL
ncbi:DUF2498 family protein, partial [Salmonella enterica subsp. enterica serovar Montevideo]|nr:DUF2498 family protein [Salmonella enterica subsp. enterica serovar Montevideo]